MEIPNPFHILIQSVIFLSVLVALSHLVFKPVMRILEERQRRMGGDREEARGLVERAEGRIRQYEIQMDQAKTEAKEIKADLLKEAAKNEREILTLAREDAAKAIAETRKKLTGEAKDMLPLLEKEAKVLAKDMACAVLGRSV